MFIGQSTNFNGIPQGFLGWVNPFTPNPTLYIVATGGTITTDGDYKIHTFNSSDTFDVTQVGVGVLGEVEYLVVAGGGGGGGGIGGGGGGGGYLTNTGFTISVQPYSVLIGAGGNGGIQVDTPATNGSDSSVFSLTSFGGGCGASRAGNTLNPLFNAGVGGSGGGGSGLQNLGANGVALQGNSGGNSDGSLLEGGGGGAGATGENGTSTSIGGAGLSSSITGSSVFRSGGGSGTRYEASIVIGGIGGGGFGGSSSSVNGGDGTINTGGGGGGAYDNANNGGNGGSGVVIIRYKYQN